MSNPSVQNIISVGVIGCGGMGTRHAVNLHRLIGGAKVGGVYDLDRLRAQACSDLCGTAQIFNDPQTLIQNDQIDAILIAAPDSLHTELTLACLEAGKPVLCEKPLATTVEDALKVLSKESEVGRKLVSVGFMRRFDPYHVAVKNAALSGELGKPLLWKGVHRNASQPYGVTGATILTNSAGHDIDSARFLLGEEIKEVYVRGLLSRPEELHPDTRDLLLLEFFMTNNTMGAAEVYVNDDYGYEVTAELVCQKGTAVTMQPDKALIRHEGNRGFPVSADWLAPFQDAYVAEVLDWIESLQQGRPFKGASAWDGYVTMQVTAACIQSLSSCEVVPVNLIDKPALYA